MTGFNNKINKKAATAWSVAKELKGGEN